MTLAQALLLRVLAVGLVSLSLGCARGRDSQPPPAYPPLVPDGGAVFFVGNSFFDWHGRSLPAWVDALGSAVSPAIELEVAGDIVPGEAPLSEFLEHAATRDALAARRYDVFVLQGFEFEPVDDERGFHAAVRDFDREIRAAGGRTALFMTWDFRFRPFIEELSASYDAIGRELGIPVIPAGLVHADCGRSPPAGEGRHFLTADAEHPDGDLHQNGQGTAVNAYTTFAMLTGRDPRGTTFAAPGNDNDATRMAYFAEKAWTRVAPRLRSGS